MPLRLNLLHEQQAARAQRKRDPLKLGLYALGGVASLFVAYYLLRLGTSASLNSQLAAKKTEYAKKYEAPLKNVDAREKELTRTTAAANALTARVEGRFYWAPLLDVLARTVPREVQIVGLNGNDDPKEKNVNFTLEGIAACK
jgi:Tfp pilus assembly protein PilN